MKTAKSQPDDLEEIAAHWAVRHAAGLGPQERVKMERWLEADPRHYAAFAEADLALSGLSPPREAHIESGAHGPNRDRPDRHNEWPRAILRHREMRLTAD